MLRGIVKKGSADAGLRQESVRIKFLVLISGAALRCRAATRRHKKLQVATWGVVFWVFCHCAQGAFNQKSVSPMDSKTNGGQMYKYVHF